MKADILFVCRFVRSKKLIRSGRVLVGEGVLMKMCRKKPKPRYFFLLNDILVYDMQIDSIPDGDDPKLRNGWIILSPKKSFSVYATTSKEKTEWMLHINNCIEKLTNRSKRLTTSTNVAPQWIPDRNADTCMRCRKAKFTVVNRRHHCRKCGFVICGDCSKNKYLLKSQADEPVRVCDVCYTALQSTGDDDNSDTSGESGTEDQQPNAQTSREPRFYE